MVRTRRQSIAVLAAMSLAWTIGACAADVAAIDRDRAIRPEAAPKPKLDLKLGDIRRYVPAQVLDTPIPDDLEEIVVRGKKPEPLPEQRAVPRGLGSLIYAVSDPLQAWRILVPDPRAEVPLRNPDDPKDPPGAFRARILEPGRIYD